LKGIRRNITKRSRWTAAVPVEVPAYHAAAAQPVIFFNIVNGFIGAFQVFDAAWILGSGSGRPNNATLTYMLNLYKQAFEFGSLGTRRRWRGCCS